MAAAVNQPNTAEITAPERLIYDDQPAEKVIPGLEKIKDEKSALTEEQQKIHKEIIKSLKDELEKQTDDETYKKVLRLREQFVHVHSTLGGDRAVDAFVVMKAIQMIEHGMKVCVLNLNFMKRLQTHALYFFLKDFAMMETMRLQKLRDMVFFRIQEEDADDIDRKTMLDDLRDVAEDGPLLVVTDETCKEVENIDDAIDNLTKNNYRFHFWSTSSYAHGTPDAAERHRLDATLTIPPPIKQIMDMIDIDDDDINIAGHRKIPIRRVRYPLPDSRPDFNIRSHLDKLKVHLISHGKTHLEPDVWECTKCGKKLAEYLADVIELGQPELNNNDVFIVGSLDRFERMVSISGMQVSLLEKDIESEVLFCRRAVRIQDILETMNSMVVSDAISMRGVDKKIVIIIPSPRDKELQEQVEKEMQRLADKEKKDAEDKARAAKIPDDGSKFTRPKPSSKDDEDILYIRLYRPGDNIDGIHQYKNPEYRRKRRPDGEDDDDEFLDEDYISEDEYDDDEPQQPSVKRKDEDLFFRHASHQSVLRRAINSMRRTDKDMILDVFTDAPKHAVLFHFAKDEYHFDPHLK